MNRTTNKGRRTWTTTTSVTLMLRNGEHRQSTLRAGETLDGFAAAAARQFGEQLVRVAYSSTEICVETGEVADVTTSWFTKGELAEVSERARRVAAIW